MTTIILDNPAVEVADLALRRGGKLLFERMNWQLQPGRFLAVTGESGAGKSTLLACLGGLISPSGGRFSFFANDTRSIGFIFQNLRLTGNLSVLTNVLCGRLGNYDWWRTFFSFNRADRQAAFKILCELGLENLVHRQIRQVSGGEQQRTAVARVLLQSPAVILADEPTSNLDAVSAFRVLSLLRRECSAANRTVVCVMHNAEAVKTFADYELKIGDSYENGWKFRKISK